MTPRQTDVRLNFPLVTIDFEASALSLQSFPIEVGIAVAASPTSEIETWSSLIRLEVDWAASDEWDPDAERVHGISQWSLRHAMPAPEVLTRLAALVPPGSPVWFVGGAYDA